VPVALVSLLVSESALISLSPRLAQLDRASAFFATAIGMIQPICLVGIQQLMAPFLMQIAKAEGHISFSEVQMKTFSRYFSFQVLNIFLVTAVAGSVFDTIAIIVDTPEAAFEMLGNSLPRMSSFFVTFVTMKTFLGLGMELVRMVALAQGAIRYLMFPNSTLRQQRGIRCGMRAIDDPGWFIFHKILAQDMLIVVISIVFAVVAPLVLIPCAIFFLLSRILWTHHHLYVYESVFETGGMFWPKIFRRFVFGLMIAQATITGQFLLKEARQEAIATIILMALTYTFLRNTRSRFDATSSALPLEVATIMDMSIEKEAELLRKSQQKQAAARAAANSNGFGHGHQNGSGNGSGSGSSGGPNGLAMPKPSSEDSEKTSYYSDIGEANVDPKILHTTIGNFDPFDLAYVQPALRASSRARPEQPFPPSQLGREEIFTGHRFAHRNSSGSTRPFPNTAIGIGNNNTTKLHMSGSDDDPKGQGGSVRLKSLHLQDRALIDRWWSDQLQRAGDQKLFSVLIGEESGTLLIGKRENMSHL
jgi:hypothetical protein